MDYDALCQIIIRNPRCFCMLVHASLGAWLPSQPGLSGIKQPNLQDPSLHGLFSPLQGWYWAKPEILIKFGSWHETWSCERVMVLMILYITWWSFALQFSWNSMCVNNGTVVINAWIDCLTAWGDRDRMRLTRAPSPLRLFVTVIVDFILIHQRNLKVLLYWLCECLKVDVVAFDTATFPCSYLLG